MGVEEFVEFLFQFNGEAVAPGEDAFEAAEICAVHAGQTQQRLVKRRYAGDEVAAVFGDEPGVALGGKPRHENAAPALPEHGVNADAETETVEQRHGREHFIPGAEHGVGGNNLLREGVKVPVGQNDALGRPGGSAGVEDDGGIVGFSADLIIIEAGVGEAHELLPADDGGVLGDPLDFSPLGEHVARADRTGEGVLHRGDDDIHDAGVCPDVLKLVIELVQCNGGDRFGFVQVELNFLFGGEGMDHIGNPADQVDGIEHIDGLRAVRHGNGDLVVLADADGLQGAGTALDLPEHLAVGGVPAHEVECDLIRVHLRNFRDFFEHGALKVVQMHGDIPHRVLPRRFCGNAVHECFCYSFNM